MVIAQLHGVLRHLQGLRDARAFAEAPDAQLLEWFARGHEEAAFAALVRRHGPMVWGVSRRVLPRVQDAEDVFQATFLLLARKAGSIRKPESVGGWLHGVARRLALKARLQQARRQSREKRAADMRQNRAGGETSLAEVQEALDAALGELPENYRAALVLCHLEGTTQEEAARRLGCPLATLRTRLARGRKLLRDRLVRHGLTLSAAGLATLLIASAAAAAAPAALVRDAVRAALPFAAGQSAAALCSRQAAGLVEGGLRAMVLTKVKMATALVLAVGLAAGAAMLMERGTAASGAAKPPASSPPPSAAAARPPAADEGDAVTYAGRVLGPDDKPVAGARVYYYFITYADEPVPVRAVTDSGGRFSFALGRKDVPLSADATQHDPRTVGDIVAKADGYTFAWRAPVQRGAPVLRLARDDTPVEGRLIDLQGKPVAGLRVSVLSAAAPEKGDLADFLKVLRAGESFYVALSRHASNLLANPLVGRQGVSLLPATTTDASGRFRLPGFARELVVQLRIEGAGIETQDVYVVTHPLGADSNRLLTPPRVKDPVFGPDAPVAVLGNGFEHAVAPGVTVAGTVRDAATGEPVPGARVESYQLAGTNLAGNSIYHTAADARGQYRFNGLPRGKGNRLRFRPPQDRPYLPAVKDVPAVETFAEATLDAALRPGVWVDVTATDQDTGKPVPGYVTYFALPKKRTPEARFQRPYADAYNDFMATRTDGTFRFVAAPGKAVVAFRADWDKYPIARGAATVWLPGGLSPSNFQAFADIDPKPGDAPVKVAFRLSNERVVTGRLVGPDGQPVTGVLAAGLRDDWFWGPDGPRGKTNTFTAIGLDPARPRLLCFVQRERKLAGSVVVRGDEKDPVTVRLQPWATVSGRLLDAQGKPIRNADLAFTEVPDRKPGQPMSLDTGLYVVTHFAGQPSLDPKTDGQGRFRVEGLVPGLKYNLTLYDREAVDFDQVHWNGLAFRGLVLKPGEAHDLGDVRLQPFPKE